MNLKDITPPILLADLANADPKTITDIETLINKMLFPVIIDVNVDEIVIAFELDRERVVLIYNVDREIHNIVPKSYHNVVNVSFNQLLLKLAK